jgi:hypothetical protein
MKKLLSSVLVLVSFNAFADAPLSGPGPAVMGLRKAFATAYQSCESLRLKPMNYDTPKVEGIKTEGFYPNSWTGHYVKITDPAAVASTHYYIRESKPAPGCLNVQENQMIYDYGGKPNTKEGILNYWVNSNGGSPGLGIDCSGFVFSSLAAGGLRLFEGKTLKAKEVHQYNAKMYKHPQESGFTCLAPKKLGVSNVLKAGDILASNYHVAMVESVGPDPFGIAKHLDDCSLITHHDFDFVIAHSSPDKNNIGINKYDARSYLSGFFKFFFRWGLVRYAREACEAQVAGKDVVPVVGYFGVSEPKTTPECMQKAIPLAGESCIQSCTEIYE